MKKPCSRKRRAIKSVVVLLCLALLMHVGNLYNFTPGAALRDWERELGIGRTEKIAQGKFTDALDAVLSAWEDRLLVTEQRWDPLMGWWMNAGQMLRRDGSKVIQLEGSASGNEDGTHLWLCGWVADPEVTKLDLRVRCRQWYGTDGEEVDVYLTVTEFQDWQEERVFLLTSQDIPATYTLHQIYLVTEHGEELLFQQ